MLAETLELKPRRYAIAGYTGNGNKVFFPAESYAIGDILITPQSELYKQLKGWQVFRREFRRNPPEDITRLLFEILPSYRIQIPEKTDSGRYKTRQLDILEIIPNLLRFALLRKLFAEKESYNLWKVGGEKAVQKDSQKPYTGKVIMTALVKSMERGGRKNVPPYYDPSVTNPFGVPLGFYDSCKDYKWTDTKEGATNISGACVHPAALQTYAYLNPHRMRNFLNVSRFNEKEFFLPFNFRESQYENLKKLPLEDLDFLTEKDLDLSHLKMDVLIDHLFNKSTYFQIGKKLMLIPNIYHPKLLEEVLNGRAFYEVIIERRMRRDVDATKLKDTNRMLAQMLEQLKQSGYKLEGYSHVLEFRATQWETVCANYEKGNHLVRILFNAKFPPVFVYRKMKPDSIPEPFLVPQYDHPFSYLFDRVEKQDDRTKQTTEFEVRIPTKIPMPESLKEDYQKAIHENFKGRLEGLVSKLRVRNEPDAGQLAAWLLS